MSKASFLCVSGLALAGLVGVGCSSSNDRTARTNNTTATERTAGETGRAATDDAAITTKVKAKMAAESRLANLKDVGVSTQNGKVTLTGEVPSDNEKKEVEQVARSVDGVTDVKNDLKVEKATAQSERHRSTRDRDRTEDRGRGDNADRTR